MSQKQSEKPRRDPLIALRLPPEVHKRFSAFAESQRRTRAAQAALIIEEFLEQQESAAA